MIVCGATPTAMGRFTVGAAEYVALPAWFASMSQVPAGPVKLTSPEASTEQPAVEEGSTENVTGFPEPPPMAVTVKEPPTTSPSGGESVKTIAWGMSVEVTVWETCGAGA